MLLVSIMRFRLVQGWMLSVLVGGCAAEVTDGEELAATESALRSGTNGDGCARSPYNCKLRSTKGQRVLTTTGGNEWNVDAAWLKAKGFVDPASGEAVVPVVDGNGNEMGRTKKKTFIFNYGQTRRMNNVTYVFAMSTGLASPGWVPLEAFVGSSELRANVGEVNARGKNLSPMACYEVKSTYPANLDNFKVVKGATDKDAMEPDDYLPVKRANGKVYANLAFNTPGDSLGGPAIDIFPAGTKFRRLNVPTWENPATPSLDATLYAKPPGSNAYTKPSGEMKFIYGYVKSNLGSVRYGWMALDGLAPSTGCPAD